MASCYNVGCSTCQNRTQVTKLSVVTDVKPWVLSYESSLGLS